MLSPMFLYFKIKKGRLQVLRNTEHSMSLLLKLLCTTDFTLRKRKCKMGEKKICTVEQSSTCPMTCIPLWAYHRNVVMNSGKVLKFSDTNLERSCRRIFKPDCGGIVSQMCSMMFCSYEYGWRSSVLSLEKKKIIIFHALIWKLNQ